jgi:hypothetical protein
VVVYLLSGIFFYARALATGTPRRAAARALGTDDLLAGQHQIRHGSLILVHDGDCCRCTHHACSFLRSGNGLGAVRADNQLQPCRVHTFDGV